MPLNLSWSLVASFLAVMRLGSLSGAARSTGMTQPTIGRHIEEVEAALAVALFTRSSSGLMPTEAAKALLPHAEAMETAMAALVRTATLGGEDESPRGTVRITASDIMGTVVLPQILATIRTKHPQIIFELALNNRTDNLLQRDADIAVRMVRPTQTGLVARKIGELPLGLYAHRSYLERFGTPETVEALLRSHLIGFDRDDHSARSVASGILPITREIFAFRCDSDSAQLAALEAGLGIGAVQKSIARQISDLVPILAETIRFKLDVWLAVHEDLIRQPAVRTVFDELATGLTQHLAD
jgi:DNA-binding transcriptional LysR family regulator